MHLICLIQNKFCLYFLPALKKIISFSLAQSFLPFPLPSQDLLV